MVLILLALWFLSTHFLAGAFWQALVANVDNDRVFINAGRNANLAPGKAVFPGSTAIIGSRSDHSAGDYAGSAYLFDTTTGAQLSKLFASDAERHDGFGIAVATGGATQHRTMGASASPLAASRRATSGQLHCTTGPSEAARRSRARAATISSPQLAGTTAANPARRQA